MEKLIQNLLWYTLLHIILKLTNNMNEQLSIKKKLSERIYYKETLYHSKFLNMFLTNLCTDL